MTGQLLGGRYELLRRIGAGGMAEVWEANDTSLGRRVAVKILHPHLAADASILARFRTEALAAARLAHPGVVSIYDTVDAGPTDAIVMELVDGRDLRTILDERGSLALDDAIEVAVQISQALSAAHQAGIVHRDIKPANIMVRPDRRVKLSDFGIAKALDDTSHTESGSVVGTVKYLAPEQIEGHPVDGRTDLYALTTVLFEMICGDVPFGARDLAGAMDRISRDAPSARSRRADVPKALDEFLARGLARNPNDRPSDARTFAASLNALRRGEPTEIQGTPSSPPPAPSESRRAEPATRPPSIPMRAPVVESPPARRKKKTRRVAQIVGTLIAAGLMIAALVTIWLLLRPASDAVSDQLETGSTAETVPTTSTIATDQPATTDTDTDTDAVASIEDGAPSSSATESTSSTTTSTTTTLPPFTEGVRVRPIDPAGDGVEHPEAAQRALDGNEATFWYTESYDTRLFGGIKPGVGLVVEFSEPTKLSALEILASNSDWSVELYEADQVETVKENWGDPIATFDQLGPLVELPTPEITTTAMMLWITDLGVGDIIDDEGRIRLEIYEIVAVS